MKTMRIIFRCGLVLLDERQTTITNIGVWVKERPISMRTMCHGIIYISTLQPSHITQHLWNLNKSHVLSSYGVSATVIAAVL